MAAEKNSRPDISAVMPAREDGTTEGLVQVVIRLRVNSDGNGVRSVIFLHGCPLSCLWCCNPETRFGEEHKCITASELARLLLRDALYYEASGGGFTFSGGEPLMQAAFIRAFLRETGSRFSCNLETSLHAPFETVLSLVPFIDEWYIDYKALTEEEHVRYTGVSCALIRENLARLAQLIPPSRICLTYPVITGMNDSEAHVNGLIDLLRRNGLSQVELHPYRKKSENKYDRMNLRYTPIDPLPEKTVRRIEDHLAAAGVTVLHRDTHVERRKCNTLKAIRRAFCEAHPEVPVTIAECTFEGRCKGTCPKCEEELDQINRWRLEQAAP